MTTINAGCIMKVAGPCRTKENIASFLGLQPLCSSPPRTRHVMLLKITPGPIDGIPQPLPSRKSKSNLLMNGKAYTNVTTSLLNVFIIVGDEKCVACLVRPGTVNHANYR